MDRKKATLKNVARHAGVSVGTVSSFINGNTKIKEKNANRIQAAINELGYVPNVLAQNLAKGESKNIMLYMATEMPISSSTWLYGMPAIQGVYSVFEQTEYYVQISINPINQPEHNYATIKNLIERHSIDGLLYFSTWSIDEQVLKMLEEQKFPYVLVGNNNPHTPENDVLVNIPDATAEAVNYLYNLGHRSFGTILGFPNQIHTKQRLEVFKTEMTKRSLPIDEKFIKTGSFDVSSGFVLMEDMIGNCDDLPTAIICGNDDIACGVIRAAMNHGIKVPDDLSVTGFDGGIISTISNPTITTMSIPTLDLGVTAAKMLLGRLTNNNACAAREVIKCELVKQGSSSGPNKSLNKQLLI